METETRARGIVARGTVGRMRENTCDRFVARGDRRASPCASPRACSFRIRVATPSADSFAFEKFKRPGDGFFGGFLKIQRARARMRVETNERAIERERERESED